MSSNKSTCLFQTKVKINNSLNLTVLIIGFRHNVEIGCQWKDHDEVLSIRYA